MVRFTVYLIAVWCVLTSRGSCGFDVIRQLDTECLPQQPTVLTVNQSDQPLITCSNNGTVATLSCQVDFHCADYLMVDVLWVGFFVPTDTRTETESDTGTEAIQYQGHYLETEQRYSSTTHKLPGEGHVLESVLKITAVTAEDYNRKFKCVVVTEYDYERMGKTPPDIRGSICANVPLAQSHQQIPENNSAGTMMYNGQVLLVVFWSMGQIYLSDLLYFI